jgi:hypothetical protein
MATSTTAVRNSEAAQQAELEAECRQAEADFANGDCIELTTAQLERCIRAAESGWPDESRG